MRIWIFLLAMFLAAALYLNRSYAAHYEWIGHEMLGSPYPKDTFIIDNPNLPPNPSKKTTLKYVAMGDSLTAGVGSADYKETFPYIFAEKLLKNSYEVTLVDLGTPGVESSDVLNRQLNLAIGENPDYVTLLIGINDINNLRSTFEYQQNMIKILDTLHSKTHAKIILMNIPLLGAEHFAVPFNTLLDDRTQQFNKVLSSLPEIKYVDYVDLYSKTKEEILLNPNFYSPDYFHPSAQGYEFWGELLNAD